MLAVSYKSATTAHQSATIAARLLMPSHMVFNEFLFRAFEMSANRS